MLLRKYCKKINFSVGIDGLVHLLELVFKKYKIILFYYLLKIEQSLYFFEFFLFSLYIIFLYLN